MTSSSAQFSSFRQAALALVLAFAGASWTPAAPPAPPIFNGAEGTFPQVTMTASLTEVQVAHPVTLTVRITAARPPQQPPQRPDFPKLARSKYPGSGRLAEFVKTFHIEPTRERQDGLTWEFDYRLHPRVAGTHTIPSWPFLYYRPDSNPKRVGTFQTTWVNEPDGLTIAVRPAPLEAPEPLFRIATGSAVLERQRQPGPASPFLVAAILLGPPLLCGGWYAAWRQLYPDAARRRQRRRSRAARKALQELCTRTSGSAAEEANRAARVVTNYLQDRLELPPGEPTPAEVGLHLQRLGVPEKLAGKAAEFFRSCDQLRFAPAVVPAEQSLSGIGADLIGALEAEPCLLSHL